MSEPASWMGRFESLGSNCEFGFVLHQSGVDQLSLLQWSESRAMGTVARLIRSGFAGLYRLENLSPFNSAMVRDAGCDICWHTRLGSTMIDPEGPPVAANFRFVEGVEAREAIWREEQRRIAFLARVTEANIRLSRRIFVYRLSQHEAFAADPALDLFDALNAVARNVLLVVGRAGPGEAAGTVRKLRPGLLHGWIDRFAPGDRAGDVSLASWQEVCGAALRLAGGSALV